MDKKFLAGKEAQQLERLTQSVVPPRLVKGSQGWYFVWYQLDPVSNVVVRHRKSFNINRLKQPFRKSRATELLTVLVSLFEYGYPYVSRRCEYDFAKFTMLKKKEQEVKSPQKVEKTVLEALLFVTELKCKLERKETVKTYKNASKRLEEWLVAQSLCEIPVSDFGVNEAQAYMDYQRLRVGNNTYNNYRGQSIVLFNAIKDRGFIAENPFLKVSKVSKVKKRRRPFTTEEAQIVLEEVWAQDDYWLFMLILLHLSEMVRRTECYRLRFRNFNLVEGYLKLEETDSKNRKESIITIPRELMVFFLDPRFTRIPVNYLIFGKGSVPHPTVPAGENTYKRRHSLLLQALQKSGRLTNIDGLSLYSWKDTGMTALAKVLTPFQLRDHARHSSIDMSLLYYHADKLITEVSTSNFSFLNGLILTQKKRLNIK